MDLRSQYDTNIKKINDDNLIDGLEVTLKGGQMGQPTFFLEAKGGPQT